MEEVKTKKCTCCGEVKPTTEFCKDKTKPTGLDSYCTKCKADKRLKNRAKTAAQRVHYREKNKEILRQKKLEYRQNNKQRLIEWSNNYYLLNKDKYAARTAKRRASILLRTPKWLSAEQLKEIETEYALREWCSKVMGEEYHVDHIVPLQGKKVSGLHVPWNLRVILATENIRKRNKFNPEEGMSMPAM
jgi:hypothetical protein